MSPSLATTLASNLSAIHARIAAARLRSQRPEREVLLVAVTKSTSSAHAAELAALGEHELGENRADELERKATRLAASGQSVRWHFLGHVQRNKARRIVQMAQVIHSVDSLELLGTLERVSAELERELDVYFQLKLGDEATKTGLAPEQLPALLALARACPHIRARGLMTMAPLFDDQGSPEAQTAARRVFRALAETAHALEVDPKARTLFHAGRVETSMGMSDDFEIAVEEGSDVVRIGSSLFAGLEPEVHA